LGVERLWIDSEVLRVGLKLVPKLVAGPASRITAATPYWQMRDVVISVGELDLDLIAVDEAEKFSAMAAPFSFHEVVSKLTLSFCPPPPLGPALRGV
jgi:hypothetical protein